MVVTDVFLVTLPVAAACIPIIFGLIWVVLYLNSHRVGIRHVGKTDRLIGLPFTGSVESFLGGSEAFFLRHQMNTRTMKPTAHVILFDIFQEKFAMFQTPEVLEMLLGSKVHITKAKGYNFISSWLGDGLLLSTGSKWFQRRKMLTPAFHFGILDNFMIVFNEQSQVLVKRLQEEVHTQHFDLIPYVIACTLDIICESIMGVKVKAQFTKDSEYVKAINRVNKIFMHRITHPWLQPEWIFLLTKLGRENKKFLQTLHNFTDEVIKQRRADLMASKSQCEENRGACVEDEDIGVKKTRLAFLDLLIKAADEEGNMSDKDIREEVDTFMFEGHDTTAMAVGWCLYLLGTSPEHQRRVQEELDEIFGDDNRKVTMDDLSRMTYLDMCIKETLRLYPSVPNVGRHADSPVQLGDATISRGTTLIISPYNTHRIPKHFPNPEVFNPEHFLPERIEKRHPFAYIPFSAGPRNCIGQRFAMMEQKVILSTVLRQYEVVAVDRREEITLIADIILRSQNGLKIRIKPRKI